MKNKCTKLASFARITASNSRLFLGAILLLITSSCGYGPKLLCTSNCGEKLYTEGDCWDFQAAENRALINFQVYVTLPNWDCRNTCHIVQGVDVLPQVNDAGFFISTDGTKVAGQELENELLISMPPDYTAAALANSAYTHELAHYLEGRINHVVEYDHAEWPYNGIYEAIRMSDNTKDPGPCY